MKVHDSYPQRAYCQEDGWTKKCVNIFHNVISATDEASYRIFRRRKGDLVEQKKFEYEMILVIAQRQQ